MRTSEKKELRDLPEEELNRKVKDLKSELFKLRIQHTAKLLDNPMEVKRVKKLIAITKTIINQKKRSQ